MTEQLKQRAMEERKATPTQERKPEHAVAFESRPLDLAEAFRAELALVRGRGHDHALVGGDRMVESSLLVLLLLLEHHDSSNNDNKSAHYCGDGSNHSTDVAARGDCAFGR